MIFSWGKILSEVLGKFQTPLYLFTFQPILDAVKELRILETNIPIRNWLSFKTQPVGQLVYNWYKLGFGIEVVSEYEYLASLNIGFNPNNILINGVAKHRWLKNQKVKNLRVHFDSLKEIELLGNQAKKMNWQIGLRFHVKGEFDPDEPEFKGQFGINPEELESVLKLLKKYDLKIESAHFHLRSNISSPIFYENAIHEVANLCKEFSIIPLYLDCGGGFPAKGDRCFDGSEFVDIYSSFDFNSLRNIFSEIPQEIPSVREIWLENGKFITSRSGLLIIKVCDIKYRNKCRYLICDGGRTNNALVSDWENHNIFTHPKRNDSLCLTTVCGPTCMAYDRLSRGYLPSDIRIGDYVIWMNAGAYHIPWETRFSNGLAKVIWYEDNQYYQIREAESFEKWWNQWKIKKN